MKWALSVFHCYKAHSLLKLVVVSTLLLAVSCARDEDGNSIVGRWKNTGSDGEVMVFWEDGSFDVLNEQGRSVIRETPEATGTWEAIVEVEPHQLYVTLTTDGNSVRFPFGIYRIVGEKLIIRQSTEVHKSLGGFDMGIVRYEMPEDFSGVTDTFIRID